uniref:Uncharacterized protein n=1 Tax=Oryza sativa subsp. japonica TaxID=39947 RepID=Q6Z0V8_ORYSJ|nr:hypothetical protein [Oryza sativa Japonica Group]
MAVPASPSRSDRQWRTQGRQGTGSGGSTIFFGDGGGVVHTLQVMDESTRHRRTGGSSKSNLLQNIKR